MDELSLKVVSIPDVEILEDVCKKTFSETFGDVNTKEDMNLFFEQNFTKKQLTNEIMNPNSIYYLLYLNDDITGYLKVNIGIAQTEKGHPNGLEIQRIYILRQYKGKGLGTFLIDQVKLLTAEQELSHIWLGVWEQNTAAIQFYEKQGFVAFDKHLFILGNDPQTDILMKYDMKKKQ